MKPVFVVGSAHLDLLAKATSGENVLDRVGEILVEVGGTACNIAMNLAAMGAAVRFATAMNRSPFSRIVVEHLVAHDIEVDVAYDDTLPLAAFSAHIGYNGRLDSATTSAPIDRHTFTEAYFLKLMAGCACAIVDCNLSSESVDNAVRAANHLNVPVFVAGVSEVKTLRVSDVTGRIDAVFFNRREAMYLKAHRLPDSDRYEDMATLLSTTLIITRDSDGVLLVTPTETESVRPPDLAADSTVHTLGMGDMFLAATVKYHVLDAQTLSVAARNATIFSREIAKRKNCNLGRAGAVVQMLDEVSHQARTDALTGLANRRSLEHMAQRAGVADKSLAVIVVDIDHFKSVNDRYGHHTGDEVLQRVARILELCARQDDAVGRWGGEEFIVILSGRAIAQVHSVAERIRSTVAERTRDPAITVSCGYAIMRDGESFAEVVRRADSALYAAKQNGRNRSLEAA